MLQRWMAKGRMGQEEERTLRDCLWDDLVEGLTKKVEGMRVKKQGQQVLGERGRWAPRWLQKECYKREI